jgi:hypothetical protein
MLVANQLPTSALTLYRSVTVLTTHRNVDLSFCQQGKSRIEINIFGQLAEKRQYSIGAAPQEELGVVR